MINILFGLDSQAFLDEYTKITKYTYNARFETVVSKPSLRDAWKQGQHCIIPADTFFEPDWRSGRAVPTQIDWTDGEPMGIAGLWSSWRSPKGDMVSSFTMLTINAASHPLMRQFHKPTDEKRMVVILAEDKYDALQAGVEHSQAKGSCGCGRRRCWTRTHKWTH